MKDWDKKGISLGQELDILEIMMIRFGMNYIIIRNMITFYKWNSYSSIIFLPTYIYCSITYIIEVGTYNF